MSRKIRIGYRLWGDTETTIKIRPPYDMLGGENNNIKFWSIPRLKDLGITYLSELGVTAPVYFVGWEMIESLGREIALLHQHLDTISFEPAELKAQMLSHLAYCYHLLLLEAPKESEPRFSVE